MARVRPQADPKACRAGTQAAPDFNEKHALETMPATIATLQIEDQGVTSASRRAGAIHPRPQNVIELESAVLAAAHADLAAAEEKWLELEILREEIAAQ